MQMRIFRVAGDVGEETINGWLREEKIERIHYVTHAHLEKGLTCVTVWWSEKIAPKIADRVRAAG